MSIGERSERKCGCRGKMRKLVTASLRTYFEERERGGGDEREIKVVKIASLKQLPGQHSNQGNQNSVFVCKRSRYRQCQGDSGTDGVDVFLPPTSWRQQLLNQPQSSGWKAHRHRQKTLLRADSFIDMFPAAWIIQRVISCNDDCGG
jgi:hypothetical protein